MVKCSISDLGVSKSKWTLSNLLVVMDDPEVMSNRSQSVNSSVRKLKRTGDRLGLRSVQKNEE